MLSKRDEKPEENDEHFRYVNNNHSDQERPVPTNDPCNDERDRIREQPNRDLVPQPARQPEAPPPVVIMMDAGYPPPPLYDPKQPVYDPNQNNYGPSQPMNAPMLPTTGAMAPPVNPSMYTAPGPGAPPK